jgi:PAS domain S-box-containing protein
MTTQLLTPPTAQLANDAVIGFVRELRTRDALLDSVVFAADRFLRSADWSGELPVRTASNLFGAALEQSGAQARLQDSERRLELLTRATLEGVLIHDGAVILDANPALLAMMGRDATEVIGCSPFSFLAPESRDLAARHARSGFAEPYELVGMRADGSRFPIELNGGTIVLDGRRARFVSIRDLTHRKRAEENERRLAAEQSAHAEAQAGRARAQFLADVSNVLSSSFDYETTLARVARLAVPYLADYCVIDMRDDVGVRRVATAAADPAQEALVGVLKTYVPELSWADNPIIRVLLGGEPLLVPDAATLPPESVAQSETHLRLLRRLAPRSAMFVPIRAGGRVVGVISLVATTASRSYSEEDLAFAENLAGRTGLAVQNAQLFHEAQHARHARDDVLSVVAHDLRNPLGVIRNGAELLSDLGLEERQRRFTEMILRAADGMNRLINDLLEMTRIESGHLALDVATLRVAPLVDETVAMMRPLAAARQIELETAIADAGTCIRADNVRVHQVLSNLIGNAIKFTPAGGNVRITCTLLGGMARFSVIDTGPGIATEEIPHIFNRFWQANRNDQRGIGLGLAIARGLVESHGGEIWVESAAGQGATFHFTLPLATATESGR